MPDLSLTQIVDVVSKAGTPKATCVASIKRQLAADYDPGTDYYRGIRSAIVEAHQAGGGKVFIRAAALAAARNRRDNYHAIAESYVGWWGRKDLRWFEPPRGSWSPGGEFSIRVNPELGLAIEGVPHVIKLYFKSDAVSKNRMDIITHLMHEQFAAVSPGVRFSLLDVRNSRLHTVEPPAGLSALIVAELAYVASLWPHV